MADKYSFVLGTIDNSFLQLKTTDNIKLGDLLEQEIFPSLELYNSRQAALKQLLCYDITESSANIKKMFGTDEFTRVSDKQKGNTRTGFASWNHPVPIIRWGAATNMGMEVLKQMSSKALTEWHNAKLKADMDLQSKRMFASMLYKTPAAAADELTQIAATPKAFWNAEGGMDVPRPNGQVVFANSHQHYVAVATGGTLLDTEMDATIALVTEHENMNGQVIVWASTATALKIKALTGFVAIKEVSALIGALNPSYQESGAVQALINGKKIMGYNVNAIGVYKNAVVIESADMPVGYIAVTHYAGEGSSEQPLAYRTHPQFPGLMIVEDNGGNPFIGADANYRRYLGLSVWNRNAGAVLYVTANTWAEPTLV